MTASPEYQTFKQHYQDLEKALDPSSVVAAAFAKDLLTSKERDEAVHMHYSDDEKLGKLLAAIDKRIASDPDVFHTFMEILEREPAFRGVVEKLKTTHRALTSSVPTAKSHQEETSKAAVFAIENRQAINGKFADFLTNVCERMVEKGVNIETFQLFVVALFPPGDCVPQSPTNVTKVCEAITHHGLWDSLHHSPLVRIVRRFGAGDPEMEAYVRDYKKDLKAYTIVASIEDCIECYLYTCTDQSRVDSAKCDLRYNCPVEWKTDFIEHSLQHLTEVWEMFSARYLGPDSPPTALIDRVRQGCLSVTWLVPSYLIPQLIKRAKSDTEFFPKHRILKVTVGDEVVYKEEKPEDTTEELKPAGTPATNRGEQPHDRQKVAVQEETYGGYDCKFIDPPPRVYQTKCPVCHLILRDPLEATCCAQSFCYTCSQRVQKDNSPCPWCRKDKFEVKENVSMRRSLNQVVVNCTYNEHGCTWSGELGELQGHLNTTDHSEYERPTNYKSPPCEEDSKSTMEWKQRDSLPIAMKSHHIVRIGNNVYCGGGLTGKVSTDRLVFKYDRQEDKWSELPICPSLHFGLTQLDGKLVTVGGRDTDELIPIKDVYIFDEDSQTWKDSNTPLSIARCSPCVFAYKSQKSVIVVSGGISSWQFDYERPSRTNSVEVFQDSQWHASVPLPFELSSMSCAVVNDTCYIIGGTKQFGLPNRQVCFISIPSLIPTDYPESSSEVSTPSPIWEHRNCPLFSSTAAEQGGNLLAIGGKDNSNCPSSAVHKYLPSTNSWETIANGSLPEPKFHAAAVSLEGGDIIVVGGKHEANVNSMDETVYIASTH